MRIYLLQCSPCGGVDLLDPEARVCFPSGGCSLSCGVVVFDPEADLFFYSALLLVESIFLTPRHKFIFYSGSLSDIQTPGLLSFCGRYIDIFFVCAPKVVPSLLGSFQHQKFLKSVEVFTWLGIGQNDPHLASGILLLPCCGWRLCTPLQVA